MTPDDLRALAGKLRKLQAGEAYEAADYLRACADAKPLPGLAPTHRCPACGALWRQCDDASWNLRSASCCGLCDAGRVELVCWLDEPKREPLTDERIASVCLSYRHDFGLLSGDEQAGLMLEARAWERAFRKEWQRC